MLDRTRWARAASILALAAIGAITKSSSAQQVVVVERQADYARLRTGIDLTGGGLFLNGIGVGLVGLDGRLGVQLNNVFALYGQAHFVFGDGTAPALLGVSGGTEVFSLTAVADFTFRQVFVGFGVGGAYFGYEPYASPEALFRFGFYPLERRHRWGRRSGLMIGADLHLEYVPHGGGDAYLEPMFLIGWEAF
jgi:hypothetical protein